MIPKERYILKRVKVGFLAVNCYILADAQSGEALIIDPGADSDAIEKKIAEMGCKPVGIVNTHGHFDHIGANAALKKKYTATLYVHADDAPYLPDPRLNSSLMTGNPVTSPAADVLLQDGDCITFGSLSVRVLHTPGHTPGCITLLVEDLAFSGDTLFCGSIGRCDLSGGNDEKMAHSLARYLNLSPETRILPGHGPECLLKSELRHNPYLRGLA